MTFLTAAGNTKGAQRGGADAWEFFYHNAGSAYHPGHESEIVGRLLGAVALARAEYMAYQSDAFVEWEDDLEPADVWNEDTNEYDKLPAMVATLYAPCAECPAEGNPWERIEQCERKSYTHILASLAGITESDDWQERNDYRRVVEAELALEAFT